MAVKMSDGIDILFSFDTTGSMAPCLGEVRRKVARLVRRLFAQVKNLRVGVIVHGDYCDAGSTYVIKMLDLTNDEDDICRFVTGVGSTYGGDAEECYELVLHDARSAQWRAGKSRVLVMIGDDLPHSPSYPLNKKRLDWRNEARMLKDSGIQVYAVQCLNFGYAESFYCELARLTGGLHLKLHQFQHIESLLFGVAFKQESAETLSAYEQELRKQGPIGYAVEDLFDVLAGRKTKKPRGRRDKLIPVDPSRFQMFEVEGLPSISDFVRSMGIKFEKGRGFYPHVTRTETIQEKKEVILVDNATGEIFTGPKVRELIGLPYGCRGRVKPNPVPGFTCWVQSTSVNRILRERAFMYEVPEKAC